MTFASFGNLTLHYLLEGPREGVPLVFLNSLGSDLRIWDSVTPPFAQRLPVLRYDKRGHGLSDCPPGPYSIRDHSNDLMGLLEGLAINKVVLVGISVGGMIALDVAVRHPERVMALVLADTAAKIGTEEFWNARIRAVREGGLVAVAGSVLQRWFTASFVKEHPADYRGYTNMLSRMPVEGYIATCEAIRDADLRGVLGDIHTQTLVLCGSEDATTTPDLGLELSNALHHARFEAIEKAGHLPCIEQADAMATKIARFLEENGYA